MRRSPASCTSSACTAATALVLAGARVIFLGANTPPEDLARTARRQHAAAVALSAAAGTSPKLLDRDVAALRSLVPADVPIVVGGAGFQRVPEGTSDMSDLRKLHQWARGLAPQASHTRRLGTENGPRGLDSGPWVPSIEQILDRTARPPAIRAARRSSRLAGADPFSVLSIGALSQATGVPVETLRTWERRYGFPAPVDRVESGHRRYPLAAIERLRLAVRALEVGHKPSVALRASLETLRDLLAATTAPGADAAGSGALVVTGRTFIERCLEHIRRLDGEALVQELEQSWNEVGTMEFLTGCVGPLLRALGEAWSEGRLEVGHEHFASEHLREFLSSKWRPMSERARGPCIVCSTISGELHVLGLHIAATAIALAGGRIIFLGANTPPEDVVRAAVDHKAAAVALSAARGVNRRVLERDVRAIRALLPPRLPIAVGGAGFDPPPPGVEPKPDLRALMRWTAELADRPH